VLRVREADVVVICRWHSLWRRVVAVDGLTERRPDRVDAEFQINCPAPQATILRVPTLGAYHGEGSMGTGRRPEYWPNVQCRIGRRRFAVIALFAVVSGLGVGCGGSASRLAQFADDVGRSSDDAAQALDDYTRVFGGTRDDALSVFEESARRTTPSTRAGLNKAADDLAQQYPNAKETPTSEFIVDVVCDAYDDMKETGFFGQRALQDAIASELLDRQAGFDSDVIADTAVLVSEIRAAEGDVSTLVGILIDELLLDCPL